MPSRATVTKSASAWGERINRYRVQVIWHQILQRSWIVALTKAKFLKGVTHLLKAGVRPQVGTSFNAGPIKMPPGGQSKDQGSHRNEDYA